MSDEPRFTWPDGFGPEGADIQDQLFDVDVQLRRQASACPYEDCLRPRSSPSSPTLAGVSSRARRRASSTARSTTPRRSLRAGSSPCR